jgi:hypothetical protein
VAWWRSWRLFVGHLPLRVFRPECRQNRAFVDGEVVAASTEELKKRCRSPPMAATPKNRDAFSTASGKIKKL